MTKSHPMLAATLMLLVGGTAAAAKTTHFIDDDYDAARAQARQRKLPMLVEVWAPW
jgi:hypothetical protein